MNRSSAIVCGVVLLVGTSSGFFGGLWYAGKRDQPTEPVRTVITDTGWEFTSGDESGPALVAGPTPLTLNSVRQGQSDDPDIAWFPDAIRETPAEPDSEALPPGEFSAGAETIVPAQLTPEQQKIWKEQLKQLPESEAEQLLQIRQSLNAEIQLEKTEAPAEGANPIKPLSATEPGSSSPEISGYAEPDRLAEPGLLDVPAAKSLRPAMPVGPLLPSNIDLASDSRSASVSASLLLRQAVEAAQLNRANVVTIGYRRREILVTRAAISTETSRGGNVQSEGDFLLQTSGEAAVAVDPRIEEAESWVTRLDLRRGEIAATRNPFDIAITGTGWFRIQHDGENVFTRCGLLAIDEENRLAVRTGAGLLTLQPVITLPQEISRIEIANDGAVLAGLPDASELKNCGTIELVDFRDAGQLFWSPKGFYEATVESGRHLQLKSSRVALRQGYIEQSNVDLKREAETLEKIRTVVSAGARP